MGTGYNSSARVSASVTGKLRNGWIQTHPVRTVDCKKKEKKKINERKQLKCMRNDIMTLPLDRAAQVAGNSPHVPAVCINIQPFIFRLLPFLSPFLLSFPVLVQPKPQLATALTLSLRFASLTSVAQPIHSLRISQQMFGVAIA